MIDLSEAVKRALEEDFINTTTIVKDQIKKATKKAVDKLKATSPKRYGKYSKSWKAKEFESTFEIQSVIHNEKHYRLTHLLEKGHQNRDGSRTKAQPHIAQVEEDVIAELESDIISELER